MPNIRRKGRYTCTPSDKLSGYTCKYCKNSNGGGIPLDKPGTLYLVYIFEFDLYKFGITSKTVKERMSDNKISYKRYEVILERKFNKGSDAMSLEKEWSDNLKEYKVNTGLLISGNTETFHI